MSASAHRATPRPAPTRIPVPVLIIALIAVVVIIGPVLALTARVPWERFGEVLRQPDTLELLQVTGYAALQSTLITLLLGVPLAVWLAGLHRGSGLVRLLVLLPLAMPPVVAGLALTAAIGNRGVTAPLLDALGLQFAFAFPGVVASHVFITLPYVVVAVESGLRQIDREIPASAAGVGLSPTEVLAKITLPAVAPAIATGGGLAFARSLGEFGTTLTFAGSMPGSTRTMPLGIYLQREIDPGASYVLAVILILLAILALAIAGLPLALKREPKPTPRAIGPLDTARIRELCRPDSGLPLTHEAAGVTTEFPANITTAIIGPNGSGKTTLVGTLAGRLRGARVKIGDQVVDGEKFRAAHQRGVVLLTQRPGLPRTATVAATVTMVTRDRELSFQLLEAAGLQELAEVKVPALSGGQAAQVALLRALAAKPRVLILDEPLAAIDVAATARWRRLLKATARDRTTILVTHDPVDISGLADHLVVLEAGRTVAQGRPADLLNVPPNDFVASLAGLNRMAGEITGITPDTVSIEVNGLLITGVPDSGYKALVGENAVATFPPEATSIRLPGSEPRESFRNNWRGRIIAVNAVPGSHVVLRVELPGQNEITVPVTRRSAVALELQEGMEVECVTKALAVNIHARPPRKRSQS
ncbi:Putative 2-aminoethylphosphonate import ATP-binding protein PhnT [Corynebacterium occultum]|uniref:2-aminoethylphosphonate import ATP-binding protein PhnT n=1 Tax=Corynebacterium occultum TaxID=2675219 RepID=A0A6B8W3G2_9CORY|nr:ATP-binding cassette domain-containing protein [Corynebacterium occultum]QGU07071.1 Putative 2-aminoethylphosphonate import ATP-binding protein PhnT [Corynebacterium occultum]